MAHRVFPETIINFVHAKDDYKSTSTFTSREKTSAPSTLDGRDVKLFYEELVGSSSPHDSAVKNDKPVSNLASDGCKSKSVHSGKRKHTPSDKLIRVRCPAKGVDPVGVHGTPVASDGCDEMVKSEVIGKSQDSSKAAARRREHKFLLCAQDGNLKELCRLVEDGVDVNVCDAYGWTALMCASHAGHLPVIQYLVNHGAHMTATDDKGRTAVDIAKLAKQRHVVKFYENVGQGSDLCVNKKCSPFYCDVCQVEFKDTPIDAHNTSTVHLFNSGLKRKPTSYFLPESNKGFQMMLRSGWDKEKGLGSEEQGHKYPVKTVLKQDRQGLGTEAVGKARVTHFGPHDREAVVGCNVKRNMKTSTLNVRACERHVSKEKRKERDFRMAFNMD